MVAKSRSKTLGEKQRELLELKKRYADALAWQKRYREENRIEFITTPPNPGFNPKQSIIVERFPDPRYKTFIMSGGNRLGKTSILTIIGLSVMFGKYPWDETDLLHLFPHGRPRKVRYVGQDWQVHVKSVVIPEVVKWWPKARPVERKGNGIIRDTFWKDKATGSTLEIMSNHQDSMLHEGWEGDLILFDEPCSREIWVANARGLVDRNGREFFAATLLGDPWIHREIVNKTDADGKPDKTVLSVLGKTWDNVGYGITREGAEAFANKLSDSERSARLEGVPSYMSGLVFPEWSRQVHLRDRFAVPLDWPVDITIDVHPREKQAVLFVATDQWNRKWVVNEIWGHGDGTWIGENIVRCVQQNAYRVNRVACDPLAKGDKNNPNTVYDKIWMVLARHGIPLEVATKDKDSGIRMIKTHLKSPNGDPALFVFDDLVRFIYEVEGWMWEKETNKPADKDDHMMENLYRNLLLGTRYTDPEEEAEDSDWRMDEGRSEVGGY